MNPRDYILERQILWAERHGIRLGGPYRHSANAAERGRGRESWVYVLEDNLFEPLEASARRDFERGDGGELKSADPLAGNMHALGAREALFNPDVAEPLPVCVWRRCDLGRLSLSLTELLLERRNLRR